MHTYNKWLKARSCWLLLYRYRIPSACRPRAAVVVLDVGLQGDALMAVHIFVT